YENDNTFERATTLNVSTTMRSQNHNFHNDTDTDYYKFYTQADKKYVFTTTGSTDTEGVIWDGSQSLVTRNNDSGSDQNFRLEWTAPTDAYYYLVVSRHLPITTKISQQDLSSPDDEIGTIRPYTFYYYIRLNLSAPTGVTASDGTYTDKIRISWDSVAEASSYRVYRSTSAAGTYSFLADTTSAYYNDTSVVSGVTFYYKVQSWHSQVGYTDSSDYDSGYRGSAQLSAPDNVSATDGTYSDKVTITWSTVGDAERYYVYRATTSGGTYSSLGFTTSTSYDDTTAEPGTTYYYKVKAWNSDSEYSEFSDSDSGYPDSTPLSAPDDVSATDGTYSDKVRISWAAVSDAEKYYVYRAYSTDSTYYSLLSYTTSTSYDDTSVTAGETYYYKVKAWNNSGYSEYSSADSGYAQVSITSVTITPATITMPLGETYTLTATVQPTDASQSVVWQSSDSSIVTVSNAGVVTAVSVGYATITAASASNADVTGTCAVTVEAASYPDTWKTKASLSTPRSNLSLSAVNGKLYAFGGSDGTQSYNLVEVYDPGNNTWTTKSPMDHKLAGHVSAVVNGKIYIIGGAYPGSADGYSNMCTEYDPANGVFTQKATIPTARYGATAEVIDNKIYVIGGAEYNMGYSGIVEVYDPANNYWSTRGSKPTPGGLQASAVVNGKIIVFGGLQSGTTKTDPAMNTYDTTTGVVEEYNPAYDTWTVHTSMQLARCAFTANELNGKVYVSGGQTVPYGYSVLNNHEEYDLSAYGWQARANMAVARHGVAGAVVDGKIYVVGGYDGDNFSAVVEEYTPPN
ncbi:kelch repeat-containing protein, partial [Candidatus Margulisiibacteriota bacterium]